LEQEFILKHYGHFSLFEISHMTAEHRKWHEQRLRKEFKDKADAEKNAMRR
jgi:hypothetical protein